MVKVDKPKSHVYAEAEALVKTSLPVGGDTDMSTVGGGAGVEQGYSIKNSTGRDFKTRSFGWARHFQQLVITGNDEC